MSKSEKRNSKGWAEVVESVIMELGLDTLKQYTDDILSECKGEIPSIYILDVMSATEKRAYEAFTHAMKEKNIWSEFLVKGVKSTSWTIYDAVEFLMSHDAMN
ncbi:MAG: hypothetical protein OXF08_07790 [Bacteroidetes bacterium]|nr:hypothetical protein [Bacteroidota bacterium]